MNRLGIFICYPPNAPMRAEGIGRLLAFIVEGAAAAGNFEVTLAAPKWSEKELHKLFEDHGIIIRDINFLLTDNIPYMVRLFWFVKRLKLKGRRKVKCSIPDDHIDPRRSALFMARSILREVREGVEGC